MDLEDLNKLLPPEKTNIESLIGKKFKRNMYGLSLWTDEITYVGYTTSILNREYSIIKLFVVGKMSSTHYSFDEIVILNELPLHWLHEATIQKREFHESLRVGNYKLIETKNESN